MHSAVSHYIFTFIMLIYPVVKTFVFFSLLHAIISLNEKPEFITTW